MERLVGNVKWFNNKTGYGFITCLDDNSDLFVHHASLVVQASQYRYLVQGEYVEFLKVTSENTKHPFMASDVTGIRRGKLMCEVRELNRNKPEKPEKPAQN
jgi:cold shock CspA family protein